jgi:hypothetical protein
MTPFTTFLLGLVLLVFGYILSRRPAWWFSRWPTLMMVSGGVAVLAAIIWAFVA